MTAVDAADAAAVRSPSPALSAPQPPRARALSTCSSRYSRASLPPPRLPLAVQQPSSAPTDRRASMPPLPASKRHRPDGPHDRRRRTFMGPPPEISLARPGLRPLQLCLSAAPNDYDAEQQLALARRRSAEQAMRKEWLRRREQLQQLEAESVHQMRGELLASVARAENSLLDMKAGWEASDKDPAGRGDGLHPLSPLTDSCIGTSAAALESFKKETQLALEAGRLVNPSTAPRPKTKSRALPAQTSRHNRTASTFSSYGLRNKALPSLPTPASAASAASPASPDPALPPRSIPHSSIHPALLPTPPQSPHRRRHSREMSDKSTGSTSDAARGQDYWRKSVHPMMS